MNVVQQMIDAWSDRDWNAVVELFTPTGVLAIVPTRQRYQGHEAIRGHLDEVANGIESLSFDIRQLTGDGSIVTFERDDVFVYNGREARVPVCGVFEIEGDRVREWREYFDGLTMGKALGML